MDTEMHCKACEHFDECYPLACGDQPYPGSLVEYFNAIRQRDLCMNNGKDLYEINKKIEPVFESKLNYPYTSTEHLEG